MDASGLFEHASMPTASRGHRKLILPLLHLLGHEAADPRRSHALFPGAERNKQERRGGAAAGAAPSVGRQHRPARRLPARLWLAPLAVGRRRYQRRLVPTRVRRAQLLRRAGRTGESPPRCVRQSDGFIDRD